MDLSADARAILLLTVPLPGDAPDGPRPLARQEYGDLAGRLLAAGARPDHLLGNLADDLLDRMDTERNPHLDRTRLDPLLERGRRLDQALDRWQAQGIGITTRADARYPVRLKQRLGQGSPAVLFHCGDPALLQAGGLAVVGSRRTSPEVTGYARNVGTLAAEAACPIVSGGARGVDRSAMDGALHGSGRVVGVLPTGLTESWMPRAAAYRQALDTGTLCLCSAYAPETGWQTWQAMERNGLIYGLSDAALVVQSDANRGGTWAGASEQIRKLRHVPVFVRAVGPSSKGLDALRELGAERWPEPADAAGFADTMRGLVPRSEPDTDGKVRPAESERVRVALPAARKAREW